MTLIDIRTLTGSQVADTVAGADFAVLPVASIEWHGPHLPLGTDTLIAEHLVSHLADSPWRAVSYPCVTYTASPGQTRSYPGTIGLRPETMVAAYTQILQGLIEVGFERILIVNAHDANMSTMRAAMEWVSGRHRVSMLLANWFQLVPPAATDEIFGTDIAARGHGGAFETTGVLAAAPEAVDLEAAPDLPPRPKLATATQHVLVESHPSPWAGWSGIVSQATPERAAEVDARARAAFHELIAAWLDTPPPEAPGGSDRRND